MIDENRLIEVIEDEILRVNTESTPGCGNLYGRDASVMRNTLNYVIDLINEQPKVNEWIPVEERMPKQSLNSVIGWDDYRERCCFVQYYMNEWILGNHETVNIVAWQPLPERYECHSKKLEKNSKGETE